VFSQRDRGAGGKAPCAGSQIHRTDYPNNPLNNIKAETLVSSPSPI
jgi:hypothetical protein